MISCLAVKPNMRNLYSARKGARENKQIHAQTIITTVQING